MAFNLLRLVKLYLFSMKPSITDANLIIVIYLSPFAGKPLLKLIHVHLQIHALLFIHSHLLTLNRLMNLALIYSYNY